MPAALRGRIARFAAAFALVVLVDQVTKAAARCLLADGRSVALVPGVLDLHLLFNEGAAFSLGAGHAWLFVVLALVIVGACGAYTLLGRPGRALSWALGCVAGGGLGNLIDRVAAGRVTDFLMTTFVSFPVFNVADVAITVGCVAAVVLFWREDSARERERARGDQVAAAATASAVAGDSVTSPEPEGEVRP